MQGYSEFISFIFIVGCVMVILNAVLFFKVWGMTNDTKKIKDMMQEWLDLEHPVIEEENKEDNVRKV